MPDDRPRSEWTEAERQTRELAALIDAAGDDLERNGPVSPAELRQRLEALETEWAKSEEADTPPGGEAGHGPR
jgi:hypothetical protein